MNFKIRKGIAVALPTLAALVGIACHDDPSSQRPPTGTTKAGLVVHPTTKRIRVAEWNVFARPSSGGVLFGSEGSAQSVEDHAAAIADTVNLHKGEFDVIVFNEVFTDLTREAIYNVLKADFPYWIKELDGEMFFLDRNMSDSGLAIFSRYPFGQLTRESDPIYYEYDASHKNEFFEDCRRDDPRYKPPTEQELEAGVTHGNTCAWPLNIGFQFTRNVDADAKAAKGWGLVKILGPGRRLNIGFTHMQADYPENGGGSYAGVRLEQLATAKDLLSRRLDPNEDADTVLTGDLNIDGLASNFRFEGSPASAANPNQRMLESEYGTTIRSQVSDLPFYDTWRTTSPEDDGRTHRFFGPPARYDYFLIDGKGYYDAPPIWNPLHPNFVNNIGHGFTCPQYVRRAFQDGVSDHVGVMLDLGPWSRACRPDMAIRPATFPDWTARSQTVQLDRLPEPGSVMWYRFDTPGAYSIGFPTGSDAAGRLKVEVYPVNDLSFVVKPFSASPSNLIPGIHDAFDTKSYFSGSQPFYVRVFDPDGLTSGDYSLLVKKHDCSSIEWECPLKPAVEIQAHAPSGVPFVGNFRIHTDSTGTNKSQMGTITVGNPSGQELRVTLTNTATGASRVESFTGTAWETKFYEAKENLYRVTIERTDPTKSYSVTYKTNLTLFTDAPDHGASLTLLEETAGWGNDEIRAVLRNELGTTRAEWFWAEMDANEGMPLFVTMPMVAPATFYVAELGAEEYSPIDPNSVDESATLTIAPLSRHVEKELGVVKEFQLCELPPNQTDCQGKLQLRYNLVHSLDP